MPRPRYLLGLVLLAAAAAAASVAMWRPFTVSGPPSTSFATATGVLHVHSTESDGSGTPSDVVRAAQAEDLDFVIVTDHGNFAASEQEGYHGHTLLIVGTEISTRSGHLLALGMKEPPFVFSDDAMEVMEDVHDARGTAIVAHPAGPREEFRWKQWDLPGPWGLELFSGDTEWRSAGWLAAARALVSYPLNPPYALLSLLRRPDETLERWDRLLSARSTPVVVGADAHGFPSYASLFALARNHLLLDRPLSGDAAADTNAIVSAIARGRAYVALDGLAAAEGFFFVAERDGMRWTMGEELAATPAPRLRAGGALPSGARVTLLRDGRVVQQSPAGIELEKAEPGVYRVEVQLPGWDVPWVVSNAISLLGPDELARRQQTSAPPVASPPPGILRLLDDFEGPTVFETAADRSSTVAHETVDLGNGGKALRMSYQLGRASADNPSPFAALFSARARDFSDAAGVVFSIRAERDTRLWLQVRDRNFKSSDGTEWWYISVKATPQWRRLAIPFDRFRSRDAHSDGRLDRDVTTGVYFIVDIGAARPESAGVVWLDDIGVYNN